MASPAVVAPQANGVAALSRPDSPASINSSTKRKREPSDDDEPNLNGPAPIKPPVNGVRASENNKSLVRDFFDVLERLDTPSSSILKRPLPDATTDGEPSTKRAKSEDTSKPAAIADKVTQDAYETLDDLVSDVVQAVNAQVKELENQDSRDENTISKTIDFKAKALELYRRELAYPNVPRPASGRPSQGGVASPAPGSLVLTTVGAAPTIRPLFTSLQHAPTPDSAIKPVPQRVLPAGVTATKILPEAPLLGEKTGRSLTLGELFPSPRNLPPLQPPKAPKTTTKGNVLSFYHPGLADKSKYRTGTYFSQSISAGQWLDYSNATPTVHPKSKQRERAQSLAGRKPSTIELEMSEMEALFRGAFSSFAPCKDDSAAIVPSGQVSRIWWQRVGRRSFAKMVEAEAPEDESEDGPARDSAVDLEFDEEAVKEAIENWDGSAIDPSLEHALGSKKSDHEKEIDDLLEEVSDMIETLASYQRNRNLTLPTSQDRYSADPVNGDMLRNGNLSHQPSEEEMMTYQALKAQLSLIIQTLPPYAVARLNSDKLAELAVSTKIEIRSDEYRGVMEEDEPARLARLAAQAASNQRQSHRTPSVSGSAYANQYQAQFTPSARPVGNAQHFPQTPVRPQPPNVYPRAPSTVPIPQPHHQVQQRAPPTQFRPQMYAPQLAKAQGPYGHTNMPQQYVPSPTQRMPQHQNYNLAQAGTPNHRFPQGYPAAGYPQHQQIHPQGQPSPLPQHSPHHPPMQQPPFSPYPNGGQMPRTMSPQVPQAHAYSQSPTPPQQHQQIARPQPPYGSPAPQPGMPPRQQHQQQQQQYGPGSPAMVPNRAAPPSNLTGFATVMPEVQQRQVMEQARARADAEQRVSGHMGKVTQGEGGGGVMGGGMGQVGGMGQGGVVGLAGIGLGGHMDVHKVAQVKMQMGGGGGNNGGGGGVGGMPSPSPGMGQGMKMQGQQGQGQQQVNGAVSPAVAGGKTG